MCVCVCVCVCLCVCVCVCLCVCVCVCVLGGRVCVCVCVLCGRCEGPCLPPHPQLQEAPWSPVFSLTLRSCRLGGKECRISDVCCEQVVRVDSCCCPSLAFLRLLQGQA